MTFPRVAAVCFFLLLAAGWLGACFVCAPRPDTRSELQRCLDGCSISQGSCGVTCKGDAVCGRTCASAYQQCLGICDKRR